MAAPAVRALAALDRRVGVAAGVGKTPGPPSPRRTGAPGRRGRRRRRAIPNRWLPTGGGARWRPRRYEAPPPPRDPAPARLDRYAPPPALLPPFSRPTPALLEVFSPSLQKEPGQGGLARTVQALQSP